MPDPRAKFLITARTDYSRAMRETKTFTRSVKASAGVAIKAVGVAGAAAAIGVVRLTMDAQKSADALAKQSDILGIATQKLAAYQLAARLSGSSNDALEKGIKKLQKSIVDATNGMTTYTRAFDALQLDPQELKNLTPDQQFERLAKSFASLETQAERVAIAYDLFGGRNTALLNTLVLTGTEINKLEADTQAWGVALTRVDAKQIENANDAVERARTALSGIGNTVALTIAPAIAAISNSFADSAAEADGFKGEIQGAMESIVVGANFAANSIRGIQLALLSAKLAALKVRELASSNGSRGPAVRPGPAGALQAFFANDKSTNEILEQMDEVGKSIETLLGKFQSGEQALEAFRAAQREAIASAREAVETAQQEPVLDLFTFDEEFEQRRKEREEEMLLQAEKVARRLVAIEEKKEKERLRLNQQTEQAIQDAKSQTADLAVGLLQALGAKSRGFAVAAIVLEKALAIQRLLLANRVAAELAFASQLIPGDPTSFARAAAAKATVLAQGQVGAALLAATGAVQIATLGSGSTGAPLGTSTNPVITNNGGQQLDERTAERSVEVHIHGNGVLLQDELVNVIRQAVDADEVFIYKGSRQAAEIRRG